jgi:hypothetical protein
LEQDLYSRENTSKYKPKKVEKNNKKKGSPQAQRKKNGSKKPNKPKKITVKNKCLK